MANLWTEGGLISTLVLYFCITFVGRTVLPFFDIVFIYRRIRQWLFIKKYYTNYTQKELNKIYEYPGFDFSQHTANMLASTYHCLFYATVLPAGLLATIIIFLCEHRVLKYVMLRHSSCKKKFGDDLCVSVLDYMDYTAVVFPLGMYTARIAFEDVSNSNNFSGTDFNGSYIYYYIAIGIGILYCLTPMRELLSGFIINIRLGVKGKYSHYIKKFEIESYEVNNPANSFRLNELNQIND